MIRQKLIICVVSLVHLTTTQFSYNVNPYYSYTDIPANQYSSLGPFNFKRPANQFHRRMYVPGLGMFRPINKFSPNPYFRNDQQVNGTSAMPSNEKYNSDVSTKYVFPYPANVLNNKNYQENEFKLVNSNQNLDEMQNSWNENPIYSKSDEYKNFMSQPPYFILKSSNYPGKTVSPGYPYMTLNLHLFNDDSHKTEKDLRASNSNVYQTDSLVKTDASNPFPLQSKTQTYPLISNNNEISSPALYYLKDPCNSEDSANSLVSPGSTTGTDINSLHIGGPFLGSIISPYLSKSIQLKNNSESFVSDVKGSHSIDTTNKNINSFGKSTNYQTKILKPDVTGSKGLTMDTSHQPIYYPNTYQNSQLDETSSVTSLNQNKETTKSKYSEDSDTSLETLNPSYYYYTDSYSPVLASNVKVFPYLTQRASSLNNYWQNIDVDNGIPNSKRYCSVENPQNSNLPSSKGPNINLSKEKLTYLIRPSSQFKRSNPTSDFLSGYVQQEVNKASNTFIPPFAQGYMSEYIGNLNNANIAGSSYEKQGSNNEGHRGNNGGYGGNYGWYGGNYGGYPGYDRKW